MPWASQFGEEMVLLVGKKESYLTSGTPHTLAVAVVAQAHRACRSWASFKSAVGESGLLANP